MEVTKKHKKQQKQNHAPPKLPATPLLPDVGVTVVVVALFRVAGNGSCGGTISKQRITHVLQHNLTVVVGPAARVLRRPLNLQVGAFVIVRL